MPKKRPVTKNNAEHLSQVVREGFSNLLAIHSILAGYFKRDEKLKQKIEKLVEDYSEFPELCKREFSKRAKM